MLLRVLCAKFYVTFTFTNTTPQDLKLRYYDLMIQHALVGEEFLAICKHFRHIYDTPSIQLNEGKWKEALQKAQELRSKYKEAKGSFYK